MIRRNSLWSCIHSWQGQEVLCGASVFGGQGCLAKCLSADPPEPAESLSALFEHLNQLWSGEAKD